MSFQGDVAAFAAKVERRARDVHNGIADLAYVSIVEGSPVTGAPGQPVDTGYLKGSWQNLIEGPLTRAIVTNCAYAPVIEEATRAAYDSRGTKGEPDPMRGSARRLGPSTVGGHFSVALTRAGWPRIVEVVTAEVTSGA